MRPHNSLYNHGGCVRVTGGKAVKVSLFSMPWKERYRGIAQTGSALLIYPLRLSVALLPDGGNSMLSYQLLTQQSVFVCRHNLVIFHASDYLLRPSYNCLHRFPHFKTSSPLTVSQPSSPLTFFQLYIYRFPSHTFSSPSSLLLPSRS
jgi:hypothetical protein